MPVEVSRVCVFKKLSAELSVCPGSMVKFECLCMTLCAFTHILCRGVVMATTTPPAQALGRAAGQTKPAVSWPTCSGVCVCSVVCAYMCVCITLL